MQRGKQAVGGGVCSSNVSSNVERIWRRPLPEQCGAIVDTIQAMAEVVVKMGTLQLVAAITEGSVKNMGLKVNDQCTVAVKATEVMIGK